MAERGRTVRVTGLPTQIQKDRLEDKLCIHFQRGSNGGGDVLQVSTVKTSLDYALVTFEDSRVAQRVIQQEQHILEVDGERFSLTVKEHPADLHQDQLIINLSATVDCSRLPAAKKTLKALNKNHPDVQIDHNLALGLCNLSGSYSTVQAALAQLLGQNQLPQTSSNKELKKSTDNRPNHAPLLPTTQVIHDQSRAHKEKREKPLVEKHSSSSQRDVTPGGYEWEAQGAAASPPGLEEDFSLMLDADMFQYLQKQCSEEYHQILRRQGVAAVDYTHQGLTTLLLQVTPGDDGRKQQRLRKAREEITQLYDANQADVCRDKLSKAILHLGAGVLKRAIDRLSAKFPKLLVSEDELYVFLIGNSDDVREARKFLLLHDHNEDENAEATSPRRFQDSWPGASPGVSESNGLEQVTDEGRSDGSPKVKLAAQFSKDSRLPGTRSKTSDFAVRGHTPSRSRPRQGPMLGFDVLSDPNGGVSSSNGDATVDARPKTTTTTSVIPIQPDSVPAPSPPSASGSGLRRSSSFSGVTPRKEQEPKSDVETGKSRGRSSSFSNGSKQEQHSAQIIVNGIIWIHLTKAYKPRIMELTSEIQMTEKRVERSQDWALLLTGTNSSKVAACQDGLQNLIDSVSADFTIKSITLVDLGVTDDSHETLKACCAEIHSLYKKISIEITDKSLYLIGPQELCSQVFKLLCEVFAGAQRSAAQQDFNVRPSTSGSADHSPTPQINGANHQVLPRKDAVVKEKVKLPDGLNGNEAAKKASVNGSSRAKRQQNVCEACGRAGPAVEEALCGAAVCSDCLPREHGQCRACEARKEPRARGIQGNMTYSTLPMSLPGHNRDPVIKITYSIPDGVQAEKHPSPGRPFQGGAFEAFLPDCEQSRRLLPRLKEAFSRGHTFTVTSSGQASWDSVPHKTSLQGGRAVSGYPDYSYLNRLSDILTSLGIE